MNDFMPTMKIDGKATRSTKEVNVLLQAKEGSTRDVL